MQLEVDRNSHKFHVCYSIYFVNTHVHILAPKPYYNVGLNVLKVLFFLNFQVQIKQLLVMLYILLFKCFFHAKYPKIAINVNIKY